MAKTWQSNESWPITSAEDEADLYRRSVVKEFHEKKPRHIADAEAYSDWRREMHGKAAAHHLRGMRAAQGAGDMESARKHGFHYATHMQLIGLDPHGPVPPEITKHAGEQVKEPIYQFRAHPSDSWATLPQA